MLKSRSANLKIDCSAALTVGERFLSSTWHRRALEEPEMTDQTSR